MVPSENATNLKDRKVIKQNSVREADTTRSFSNRIRTHRATLFRHVMRREKLELLVTTGIIQGKRNRVKTVR